MADEKAERPVLETLDLMTAASLEHCHLPGRELMLTRIAALVAADAPVASYLVNAGAAADSGVVLEDVQDVLVAVAPIVGSPRVVSAAARISVALGYAIAAAVDEAQAEEEAQVRKEVQTEAGGGTA